MAPDLAKLPAAAGMGAVGLRVADLAKMIDFYQRGVGLALLSRSQARASLGRGANTLIELVHTPDLPPAPPGQAGLFHSAILFESRQDLAASLYRAAVNFSGSYSGSADHLVSNAFYFDDPEGNGLELCWDRPREQWQWEAGSLRMGSLPLDPNRFIAENSVGGVAAPDPEAPAKMGHVHLKVGDIPEARRFYVDLLGFEVTTAYGQQALFTSAGGYHHHLGMNTWHSRGATRRGQTLGLHHLTIEVPAARDVQDLAERVSGSAPAAVIVQPDATVQDGEPASRLELDDPWGNRVVVKVSATEGQRN